MAKAADDRGGADSSVADELRKRGLKNSNILVRMAEAGQLLELKCEMPQCYHPRGRREFDPVEKQRTKWSPSRDHYPILASADGKLGPDNVRLAHTECNQRDHLRRRQIGPRLADGMSLEEIADVLNRKRIPPFHGTNRWTAPMVRKAYVS
jgi:hypothetical protein